MPGLGISYLPCPTKANRIDLLARGFETEQDAAFEDTLRAKSARSQAEKHGGRWGDRAAQMADILDPKLHPELPVTLASSRHFRDIRIRFLSEVLRLLNESEADLRSLVRADVIKPKLACDVFGLQDSDPKAMLDELRADLLRVAPANTKKGFRRDLSKRKGFLLAAVHGEFDPIAELYQPHVHVIATQDYVDLVDRLRTLKGYKPTERVRTPVRITRNIFDLPGALTYLLKSYWPQRPFLPLGSDGALKRPRNHQRIDEPFHTNLLLWLDKWQVSDLILMMGLRVGKIGLNINT